MSRKFKFNLNVTGIKGALLHEYMNVNINVKVKVKVKVTLEQTTKAQR
jgi:hypothetical protein